MSVLTLPMQLLRILLTLTTTLVALPLFLLAVTLVVAGAGIGALAQAIRSPTSRSASSEFSRADRRRLERQVRRGG